MWMNKKMDGRRGTQHVTRVGPAAKFDEMTSELFGGLAALAKAALDAAACDAGQARGGRRARQEAAGGPGGRGQAVGRLLGHLPMTCRC